MDAVQDSPRARRLTRRRRQLDDLDAVRRSTPAPAPEPMPRESVASPSAVVAPGLASPASLRLQGAGLAAIVIGVTTLVAGLVRAPFPAAALGSVAIAIGAGLCFATRWAPSHEPTVGHEAEGRPPESAKEPPRPWDDLDDRLQRLASRLERAAGA